jgi:hypothetical protein
MAPLEAEGALGSAFAVGASALAAGAVAALDAGFAAAFLGAGFAAGFFAAAFFLSLAFTGEGRDLRPRRCALPITALRLTPPSSSAIWLAVDPPSHIFLSVAMRSSVQLIEFYPFSNRYAPTMWGVYGQMPELFIESPVVIT